MDPSLNRGAIASLWPQQPDCVLSVIPRNRDKLIENLRPLGPAARSMSIPNSRYQLGFRGHADPPHPPLPSSSPVGSIAAEAINLIVNIQAEAMRPPVRH